MMSREWFCVIFVPHGETVNAQYYAAYMQNHLCRAVRHKQPQLQNVINLHDNATLYKAICVRDLLRCRRWEVLEHPPYSPDLSPCDYDLTPKLKAPLRGHRFRTRDDIAIAVRRLIMTNFSHGESDGIRRLPHRSQSWGLLWRLAKCWCVCEMFSSLMDIT